MKVICINNILVFKFNISIYLSIYLHNLFKNLIKYTMAETFKPEDYSRFLIREFLKRNGFEKTYEQFMAEDTRPRVTMTKNELTRLLGIDALMKRNSKNKTFE